MRVDTHERQLKNIGLGPDDYRALIMLPVVPVLWANGKLFGHARDRAIEVGREAFALERAAMDVLRRWLVRPPSWQMLDGGFEALSRLVRAVDEPHFDLDMVQLSLTHAEALARDNVAEPTRRGTPRALNAAERATLRHVADALGIDHGESWADLAETVRGSARTQPEAAPPDQPGGEEHEVSERSLSARFDVPRGDDNPAPEAPSSAVRHLKTALRAKKTENETSPPQVKEGKT